MRVRARLHRPFHIHPASSPYQFRCKSGQCVTSVKLCDGLVDCLDGTDETTAECGGDRAADCGPRSFRCDYGACVSADAPCNGVRDCADYSDESSQRCSALGSSGGSGGGGGGGGGGGVAGILADDGVDGGEGIGASDGVYGGGGSGGGGGRDCLSGREFRCGNGRCVSSALICDGSADCSDGSDETLEVCGSFNCPQYTFRCDYGACIDKDKKCNGREDCADGSDEYPVLCLTIPTTTRRPTKSTTTTTTSTTQTPYRPYYIEVARPTRPPPRPNKNGGSSTTTMRTTTTTTTTPWPVRPSRPTTRPTSMEADDCELPPHPRNGRWRLVTGLCSYGYSGCREGDQVPPGSQIAYECDRGYRINGSAEAFCVYSGEWSVTPKCEEIHCPALGSVALQALCNYGEGWTSCDRPALPKTLARLNCRNGYTVEATNILRRTEISCSSEGKWDPQPIICIPECGIPATGSGKPLIVNGVTAKVSEFPWHATLYHLIDGVKTFICGATIIKDDLLVTAAHCVFSDSTKKAQNPSEYYVAAGNIFRDYDYEEHNTSIVKKARVKKIIITCNYIGLEGNHAGDIAILQINKPFVFSALVMPICLDINTRNDQNALVSGYGKVPGFGITESGNSSFILLSLSVPFIPHEICKAETAATRDQRFFTQDKFCAGYKNGSSVCDGDSGGGLVFETDGKWFLRGIVSLGIGALKVDSIRHCNTKEYALYTRVASHIEWIQEVILRLETNKPMVVCG